MTTQAYVATLEAKLAAMEDRPLSSDSEQAHAQKVWAWWIKNKRPIDPNEKYHAPPEKLPIADHERPKATFRYHDDGTYSIAEDRPNAAVYWHTIGQCGCQLCTTRRKYQRR